MIPNSSLALTADQKVYISPEGADYGLLTSLERGGRYLNDASSGRDVQTWTARIDGQDIKVSAPGVEETVLLTLTGELTAVGLAFDPNMQPVLLYRMDGVFRLRYWDSTSASFLTMLLTGATSARICVDDHRDGNSDFSDVIVGYVRDDVLYWRAERERYATEHTAGSAQGRQLSRLGMTTDYRLAFELRVQ